MRHARQRAEGGQQQQKQSDREGLFVIELRSDSNFASNNPLVENGEERPQHDGEGTKLAAEDC